MKIPPLDKRSQTWTVLDNNTGEPIIQFFEQAQLEQFVNDSHIVMTTYDYYNRLINIGKHKSH